MFEHLAARGETHLLKLTQGAGVKGRLVKDGQPVTGAEIEARMSARHCRVRESRPEEFVALVSLTLTALAAVLTVASGTQVARFEVA